MNSKSRNTSIIMLAILLGTLTSITFKPATVESSNKTISTRSDGKTYSPANCSHWVKLITGDTVRVAYTSDGQRTIDILSVDDTKSTRSFLLYESQAGTYVIPSDANLEELDAELFNIDYLISEGYDQMATLPLIVSLSNPNRQAAHTVAEELTKNFKTGATALFSAQSALSVRLPIQTIKNAAQTLLTRSDVKKIWLDRKRHVSLSESVPLIGVPKLWDLGYDGNGIQIAILDTGIDKTHPDLDDLDDNPNTTDPKVVKEIDFTDESTTLDLFGHGTHCAGIAAGTGAMSGGKNRGVAPAAKLWNVRVLDSQGSGYDSWVMSGVEYAANGPDGIPNTGDEADVISMSLGGPPTDGTDPLSRAVDAAVDAGVVVVIAAGNSYDYLQIGAPGVARKAITVGASDKQDELAPFSSKGPTVDFRVKPDVVAPGVSINSTVPYGLTGTYYQTKSGTSMATPHVAGLSALMLQARRRKPPGWSMPKYVKNTLISTAKDLGYNVYEQGGGRINATSALSTDIMVDPATISLGSYSSVNTTGHAVITFSNLNTTSSHTLNLNVSVHDALKGPKADCATLNATTLNIGPSSNASILLTINATVTRSIFSGKLDAITDDGKTLHVIFGFTKMCRLTISKTNRWGYPAHDPFFVFGNPGIPRWVDSLQPDSNGNATLYVTEGTYYIHSIGYTYSGGEKEALILTSAENVSVTGDTTVHLDERNTFSVDFNPNKPGQIIAHEFLTLTLKNVFAHIFTWQYPEKTLAFMSPIHILKATFIYDYYPAEYFPGYDLSPIDSPEWHTLVYAPDELTQNTTFVAEYDKLVRRTTDYKTAMVSEDAWRFQLASHPNLDGIGMAAGWILTAPKRITQWLSPEPALYSGIYAQKVPWSHWPVDGAWIYESLYENSEGSYPPASSPYFAYGEHPFTSSVHADFETQSLHLYGTISKDAFGTTFWSGARSKAGNITVLEDGVRMYEREISDWLDESIRFSGTPLFNVIIKGNNPINLSTRTVTELTFTANLTQDHQPPGVKIRLPRSGLDSSVSRGKALVNVTATDDTAVSSLDLEVSLDDGATWTKPTELDNLNGTRQFFLGVLGEGNYVSFRVNATDQAGNKISQTIIRGVYIAPWGDVAVREVSPSKTVIGQGYPLDIDVTVENLGDQPETFNVTLLASKQLPSKVLDFSLFGSEYSGWGFTPWTMMIPGPTITVNEGDVVNLTLTSVDGLAYNFFVDYNKDMLPNADEPRTPDFSETISYKFTAANVGRFNYYCQYYESEMYGAFVVQEHPTVTVQLDKRQVHLDNGTSAIIQFSWNTSGFAKVVYTISATAGPVRGETDIADNTFTDGNVTIAMTGDISGPLGIPDGKVDIIDVAVETKAFGTYSNHPKWNPNADINCDKRVDIADLAKVAKNFGKIDA